MLAASFGKSEGNSACVAERASFAGSAFSFSSLPLSPLLDRDLRDFFPLRPLLLSLLSSDLEDDEDEEELEGSSMLLQCSGLAFRAISTVTKFLLERIIKSLKRYDTP